MGWGWSGETRAGVTIHAVNVGPRVLSSQVKGEIVDGLGRQEAIRVSWQSLTSRARELWELGSTPCMRRILLVWLAGSSDPLRVSRETQCYPGSLLPLYLPPHQGVVGAVMGRADWAVPLGRKAADQTVSRKARG